MRTRQEYDALLASLKGNAAPVTADGLQLELRSCFDRQPGCQDPRTATASRLTRGEFHAKRDQLDPELWANEIHLFGPEEPKKLSALELLRTQFGWVSSDLSCGVRTLHRQIPGPHGPVSLYQYERPSAEKGRPCVVFIHGGGFFGGVIPTVENQCKLLAQKMGGVVLSVEYPLCPENKYPLGFDACYAAVEWAHENRSRLGIGKIGAAGDSAGGNLSLACGLRDRDEGRGMLSFLGLIYPAATQLESVEAPVYWDPARYENPQADPVIEEQIRVIGSMGVVNEWYLADPAQARDPYVSPLEAELAGLPETVVMTAEYDFLRLQCEELSRRLQAAGVKTRHIRYGGIFHGTFDRLGYAPQVEDMLQVIADGMRG